MVRQTLVAGLVIAALCAPVLSEEMSPEIKAKIEARAKSLSALSKDKKIVDAVKAYNANPPAEYKDMTQDKWKELTVLSPEVKGLVKNELGVYLKSLKDSTIAELFVSASDGNKVAFLAKTSNWSHKGKPKHDVPMTGKTWFGKVEVDESSGQRQVQIGLPVLDGEKAIGSIVLGLSVGKL